MEQGNSTNEKRNGLLPPGRVSKVYDRHLTTATVGGTTVRILAVTAGIGLLAASISIWTHWILDNSFSISGLIVSLISVIVGISALLLESHLESVEGVKSTIITSYVPVLGQVSARGLLYMLGGVVQFFILAPLHIVVGLFTSLVGYRMTRIGRKATESLNDLKSSIVSEAKLLNAFQTHDKNNDGVLEIFEFEGLVLSLGVELDSDELDAAFFAIDVNNDQKIAYDEFRTWWKESTPELREGTFFGGEKV